MDNQILKAIDIKKVIVTSIVGVILGLVLLVSPSSDLVGWIVASISLIIIGANVYSLYKKTSIQKETTNEMLLDGLAALLAFFLITSGNIILDIILSIYLIGLSVYKLIAGDFKKDIINKEVPMIVLGIILFMSIFKSIVIFFRVVGAVLILGGLVYCLLNYISYKKSKIKIIK